MDVIIKSLGYRCNVITRSHTSLSCGLYPLLSSIFSCRNSYPSQLESHCQVKSPFTGTFNIARNITYTITPGNRTPTPVIDPLNPTPGSSACTPWLCSTIHTTAYHLQSTFVSSIHHCRLPSTRHHSGISPTEIPLVTIYPSVSSRLMSLPVVPPVDSTTSLSTSRHSCNSNRFIHPYSIPPHHCRTHWYSCSTSFLFFHSVALFGTLDTPVVPPVTPLPLEIHSSKTTLDDSHFFFFSYPGLLPIRFGCLPIRTSCPCSCRLRRLRYWLRHLRYSGRLPLWSEPLAPLVVLRSPLAILVRASCSLRASCPLVLVAPLALFGPLALLILLGAACSSCSAACLIGSSLLLLLLSGRLPFGRLPLALTAIDCSLLETLLVFGPLALLLPHGDLLPFGCRSYYKDLLLRISILETWYRSILRLSILLQGSVVEDVDTRNVVPIDPPVVEDTRSSGC